MVKTHNLGFPRIGRQRELKFALEKYWRHETDIAQLLLVAAQLCQTNWQYQQQLDLIPVGDFSLYDHVLDTSQMMGNLPARVDKTLGKRNQYFQAARGQAPGADSAIAAVEMTKWFDTNYHYLVPEFEANTHFHLQADNLTVTTRTSTTVRPSMQTCITGACELSMAWKKQRSDR